MSRIRKAGVPFVLSLALLCASIGVASGSGISTQPKTHVAAQETAVVGADGCSFAHGFALGLGIAGLFGCVPCEVGALVVEAGALIACS